jgi:replicative DNA helicase
VSRAIPFVEPANSNGNGAGTRQAEPHDLHLERDILGACVTFPDVIMTSQVVASDFYSGANATIWRALLRLVADEGEKVDTAKLRGALHDAGRLQYVGGDEYLADLTAGIPSRDVDFRRLRVLARQRRVHEAARALANTRGDEISRALARLDVARRELEQLEAGERDVREMYKPLAASIVESLRPVGVRMSTGFATLDMATRGGIPLGRVVMLLGAPGSAKTTGAAYLMHRWEQAGAACVYLAADEPPDGIVMRLGQLSGFSREGLESEDEIGEATRHGFARHAAGRAIAVIDPDADESMHNIEDAERALVHLAGERPRVLLVDSLQTAYCAAADAADNARERTDIKLAVLRKIAKRGALVVVISEMSRAGYRSGTRGDNISALAAGKESGGIEYGASLLLGLRSVAGENGLVDVETGKNRLGGSKPAFRLRLDFDRASFTEVPLPDEPTERQDRDRAKLTAARHRVIAAVLKHPDLTSRNTIHVAAGGDRTVNLKAIAELMLEGVLYKVGNVFRVDSTASEGT